MSSKSVYSITGEQKEKIINGKGSFYIMKNGEIINKAHIVEFKLNYEETKKNVRKIKPKVFTNNTQEEKQMNIEDLQKMKKNLLKKLSM
jgi:hypothetical protein